ncbi:dipeptide ABC transporter ATP-binding protein [Nocardiopsis sediminis]|uniref:Dipeptide ABC transporter ATP-binding protein n=1 Tax=Nocardiopsis sediminis TaxID=1778267 RepID=A0ABV8FNF1_9ACTN
MTRTAHPTAADIAAPDPGTPVLAVEDLSVAYTGRTTETRVLHGVSLTVDPGEVVAVVGESGSGKSTTAQSVIGLLPGNGRVLGGRILLNGTDITAWGERRMEAVRGARIGLVPQDPGDSLNPVKRIGDTLAEALDIHRWGDRRRVRARVLELLERVGIPDPVRRARQYPHELSGGMRQRVLIAAAIALRPDLVIADEATSALDVTVQRTVLDLLDDLRREDGTAVLLVTHDLAVAADRADRVVVLKDGRVRESGPTATVLTRPADDYTRTLLADAPSLTAAGRSRAPAATDGRTGIHAPSRTDAGPTPAPAASQLRPAIDVRDLVQDFGSRRDPFRAVDGVSFTVAPGTTHALVGESGSGKTTTARVVMGLTRPTSGHVTVAGRDLAGLSRRDLRELRRNLQLVYQNPYGSLDPRRSVRDIVAEPLRNHGIGDRGARAATVEEFLDRVALPGHLRGHRPRELSGGQRQRVAIARALVLRPDVVVLDEPVSALDVTVQARILDLLERLQDELGTTYLFISHDLAVVRRLAHTVTVMTRGRAVESGPVGDVFSAPRHDYTRALIDAIPGHQAATGSVRHAPAPTGPTGPRAPQGEPVRSDGKVR